MMTRGFGCPKLQMPAVNIAEVVLVVGVLNLAVDLGRHFAWPVTACEYWKTMVLERWRMLVLQDECYLSAEYELLWLLALSEVLLVA